MREERKHRGRKQRGREESKEQSGQSSKEKEEGQMVAYTKAGVRDSHRNGAGATLT